MTKTADGVSTDRSAARFHEHDACSLSSSSAGVSLGDAGRAPSAVTPFQLQHLGDGRAVCVKACVALALGFFVLLVAGCNIDKYDNYHDCSLEDGRYQVIVSVAHDSSDTTAGNQPPIYARLCRELVGGPGVHLTRPSKP